jgi:hypothetical protein
VDSADPALEQTATNATVDTQPRCHPWMNEIKF